MDDTLASRERIEIAQKMDGEPESCPQRLHLSIDDSKIVVRLVSIGGNIDMSSVGVAVFHETVIEMERG